MSCRRPKRVVLLFAALLATGGCDMSTGTATRDETGPSRPAGAEPLAVGILGDSDSHAYHDDINLPPPQRGGERFRSLTLQWTEVLDRLRGDQIDFGAWGTWGTRRRYAIFRRLVGGTPRYPRKQDFEYNMALSGATCDDLTSGASRQAASLRQLIADDPRRWDRGLIVVRIGINSVATEAQLERYATTGLTADAAARIDACVAHVEAAIRAVRSAHAAVPIAVVGIAEDINGPPLSERWQSREAVERIRSVLDRFDAMLTDLAAGNAGAVFVDDREWWKRAWGGRDEAGAHRPRSVRLGGATAVANRRGNHPANAITADGHAGTVANGLWAHQLIRTVNDAFGLGISPPLDAEIADLVDADGALGIAPATTATGEPRISMSRTSARIRVAELPFTVPPFAARDAGGEDIAATAVAFAVEPDGGRSWLYGDGDNLQLRRERFGAGQHDVRIVVRDRNGRTATARIEITIID